MIKNYTSQVPASRSIEEIQHSLVMHGARGVMYEYEQGTGRVSSLRFAIDVDGSTIPFMLPVDWRAFQAVLKEQRVSRHRDEDYCYRIAWRCLRDWVLAQMALIETQMVSLPQVFLPYTVVGKRGGTLYDQFTLRGLPGLIGEGKE